MRPTFPAGHPRRPWPSKEASLQPPPPAWTGLEAYFNAAGMPSQQNNLDSFRFRRSAVYQSLKSKVGLAAAKAAALRINLDIEGCGVVAPPMQALSRTPLLLPLLLSHNLPSQRSLVRDGQTSPHRPRLVVSCSACLGAHVSEHMSRSTCPPLPPSPLANSFIIGLQQ